MNSDVVILAGGLGTRLSHLIPDLPKPMAPVNGKPFLEILLEQLSSYNFQRIILSVGHKYEKIETYFGNSYKNIELIYCIEDTPLGTGGAIKKAMSMCKNDNVFIINGDTYFDVNFNEMMESHLRLNSDVSIAVKKLKNFDRYGTVTFLGNKITGFFEKKPTSEGYINGGTYLLTHGKIKLEDYQDKFSFEKDILEMKYNQLNFNVFISDNYFIDIGIPEDYEIACSYFK